MLACGPCTNDALFLPPGLRIVTTTRSNTPPASRTYSRNDRFIAVPPKRILENHMGSFEDRGTKLRLNLPGAGAT